MAKKQKTHSLSPAARKRVADRTREASAIQKKLSSSPGIQELMELHSDIQSIGVTWGWHFRAVAISRSASNANKTAI